MPVPTDEKVKLRLTAFGAVIGAAIAFVMVGAIQETLWVLLGAAVGWVAGMGLAMLMRRWRQVEEVSDEAAHLERQHTADELYEKADELDIRGRSDMNKRELAEAVASQGS